MPISISIIEAKEFKIVRKGFDPQEVDLFLDEICDHIDLLNRQIDALQQRVAQASQGPGYARAAVPPPAATVDYAAQAQNAHTACSTCDDFLCSFNIVSINVRKLCFSDFFKVFLRKSSNLVAKWVS